MFINPVTQFLLYILAGTMGIRCLQPQKQTTCCNDTGKYSYAQNQGNISGISFYHLPKNIGNVKYETNIAKERCPLKQYLHSDILLCLPHLFN